MLVNSFSTHFAKCYRILVEIMWIVNVPTLYYSLGTVSKEPLNTPIAWHNEYIINSRQLSISQIKCLLSRRRTSSYLSLCLKNDSDFVLFTGKSFTMDNNHTLFLLFKNWLWFWGYHQSACFSLLVKFWVE